jgi:hypothetical protein
MKRSETEYGAALVVFALQQRAAGWEPISLKEIARIAGEAIDAKTQPLAGWARNPFARPDLGSMVREGFAVESGPENDRSIAFTEKGLKALAHWVRRRWLNREAP